MASEINTVFKDIEKIVGKGLILYANEYEDAERVSSGSLNLDFAMGGGFPKGHIVEVYGPYASGKTTVALVYAANLQRMDPSAYVVYFDAETTASRSLMESYGLNMDRTILVQTNVAEDIIDSIIRLLDGAAPALIIVDSIPSMVPSKVNLGSAADMTIGLLPKLLSEHIRRIKQRLYNTNSTMILINQLREKPGVMHGNPEVRPGGRAVGFAISIDLEVRRGDLIIDEKTKNQIGHQMRIKVTKNKCSPHINTVAMCPLYYGVGIDKVQEIFDMMLNTEKIVRAGAYYKFNDAEGKPVERYLPEDLITDEKERIVLNFQGKDSFINHLRLDTELCDCFEDMLRGNDVPLEKIINAPPANAEAS